MRFGFLLTALLFTASLASASSYVLQSDGYYYADGVPYSRTWVEPYYYWHNNCRYYQAGYWQYTRVKVIEKTVEKTVEKATPLDWRTKLLELRKEQIEQQNYVDSIRFLGLDAPYQPRLLSGYGQITSVIGTYGAQGATQYGYSVNSLADFYGVNDTTIQWQQLARILEGTQGILGQGTADYMAILGREGDNKARVAEIIAKGQVIDRVLRESAKTETKKIDFKIGPEPKNEAVVPERGSSVYKTWQAQAQGCANCHFGQNPKGGFQIASWPGLPAQKKAELAAKHLLTNDPAKLMTPTRTDADPGKPLDPKDVVNVWMAVTKE